MSVSFRTTEGPLDVTMVQDEVYTLPEDNDHVKSLEAQGYIEATKAKVAAPVKDSIKQETSK